MTDAKNMTFHTHLMAIFQNTRVSRYKSVSIWDFIGAKNDGGGAITDQNPLLGSSCPAYKMTRCQRYRQSRIMAVLTYRRIRHDHHDVSVGREAVDVRGEHRVAHFHAREVRRHFAAAQLELFYDVADLLKPMRVRVWMRPVLTV